MLKLKQSFSQNKPASVPVFPALSLLVSQSEFRALHRPTGELTCTLQAHLAELCVLTVTLSICEEEGVHRGLCDSSSGEKNSSGACSFSKRGNQAEGG